MILSRVHIQLPGELCKILTRCCAESRSVRAAPVILTYEPWLRTILRRSQNQPAIRIAEEALKRSFLGPTTEILNRCVWVWT